MSNTSGGPQQKIFRRGTHRAATLEETWERFGSLASAVGVTRLAEITGLDRCAIPTFVGIRPLSRGLTTSQGKGVTRLAAKISALMEAIEGWHGESAKASAFASFEHAELETGVRPIDPGKLPRRGSRPLGRIPWSTAKDLISGDDVLVPFDSVSTDFTDAWASALYRTSNGLASGNTIKEAIVHGLLEVIERNVLSDYLVQKRTEIVLDLNSVEDDINGELLARLTHADLLVRVGVLIYKPVTVVYAMMLPRIQGRDPVDACVSGYGAHLDPKIALTRALTEAAQSRATLISGSRDDLWPSHYERVSRPKVTAKWRSYILGAEPSITMRELPDSSTETFDLDLKALVSGLKASAVCVTDLTLQDMGVPVVKVVVPGLNGLPFSHAGASRGDKK